MSRAVTASVRLPKTLLVLCLLGVALCAAGLPRLGITSDTRVYFPPDNPYLTKLNAFEDVFSQNNNVLFVVLPKEGTVLQPRIIEAIGELTARSWKLPHATRADSLTNFLHVEGDEDSFLLEDLVPSPDRVSQADIDRITTVVPGEPFLKDRLVASDYGAAGVNVNFLIPPEASAEVQEIVTAARALADELSGEYPEISIHLTGNILLMGAFAEAALNDMTLLLPISFAVVGVMLLVFLRSISAMIAVGSMLALATAGALGLAGWADRVLNPASSASPVIIMTLGIASAVHIVTLMQREMAAGRSKLEALEQSIRLNFTPITLTSLTTAVGFFALNLADAPPFNDLGNIVVAGIFLGYILTFLWVPAVLVFLPMRPRATASHRFMARFGTFVERNSTASFVVVGLLMIAITLGLTRISLDDDFIRYFDHRFDYRVASDIAEEHLTGLNIIEFEIGSDGDGGVYDPSYQHKLEGFVEWLRARPEVTSVLAITDITRKIDRVLANKDTGHIPDDRELIAQYFLLYEMSLPFGMDITDQINVSRSASRVTAILRGVTSGQINEINSEAQAWLAENAPDYMVAEGTSINVLFANLSRINIRSMILSTIASLFVIAFIVGFALRSFSYGVIGLLTMLLPAVIGFGAWGYIAGQVDLAASIITAMTLGIVVDDAIHFLMKYRYCRKQMGLSPGDSVVHVFETVGVAMMVTTVALIAGFLVLTLSGYEANRTIGAFTAVIIGIALIVDWFLLPPYLQFWDRRAGAADGERLPGQHSSVAQEVE